MESSSERIEDVGWRALVRGRMCSHIGLVSSHVRHDLHPGLGLKFDLFGVSVWDWDQFIMNCVGKTKIY